MASGTSMDKDNELFEQCETAIGQGSFKAHFDNWAVNGLGKIVAGLGPREMIETSQIMRRSDGQLMISQNRNWALTESGSLYSLNPDGEYKSYSEYIELVESGQIKYNQKPERTYRKVQRDCL